MSELNKENKKSTAGKVPVWVFVLVLVVLLGGAYMLHFRERRRCDTAGCRLVGQRTTTRLLRIAFAVVVAALLLRLFPSWTADVLQRLS